ncbi:adhesion G protein-coupled receptor B2 [Trichonephila clavipes]|uniref:Adhesion G protein-coupled receptor B2 n=1 Tax=Trichonephila clavipes TaxID=2585209 RepID=A0A8X7B8N5_TRICX|nr:adhesion G protein-coupled receptor B2 [Trichonephila clavipes]
MSELMGFDSMCPELGKMPTSYYLKIFLVYGFLKYGHIQHERIGHLRYRTLNCNKRTVYFSIDMNVFYSKDNLVALHFKYDFWHTTAKAGSDVVQSGRPIFDDIFQHLWPYIGNNTVNVVFQMVKRLWLIRIDQ